MGGPKRCGSGGDGFVPICAEFADRVLSRVPNFQGSFPVSDARDVIEQIDTQHTDDLLRGKIDGLVPIQLKEDESQYEETYSVTRVRQLDELVKADPERFAQQFGKDGKDPDFFVETFLTERGHRVDSLEFDGLKVWRNGDDGAFPRDILDEAEQYLAIQDIGGGTHSVFVPIKLEEKEMKSKYLIHLP